MDKTKYKKVNFDKNSYKNIRLNESTKETPFHHRQCKNSFPTLLKKVKSHISKTRYYAI